MFEEGDIIRSVYIKSEDKTYTLDRAFKLGDLLWKLDVGDVVVFNTERQGVMVDLSVIVNQNALKLV